ncbi:D-beta-hydroxybutyrate dehydrogenase, mitochondrial-like [Amblyomma americanum]
MATLQLAFSAGLVLWTAVSRLSVLLTVATNAVLLVLALCCLSRCVSRIFFNGLVDAKGKSVLITGCDTGFGHRLAKRLAENGFRVYAGCLSSVSDGACVLKLVPNVHVLQLDVTKEDEIDEAYKEIINADYQTALWAVVANAGVMTVGPLEWHCMDQVRALFDVNVFGVTRVVVKFLPLLRKTGGRIVIVSSMFGRMTGAFTIPYCMTKHACISLADGLRRRFYGTKLRVITIEPTAYRTALSDPEEIKRRMDELVASLPPEAKKDIDPARVSKVRAMARVFVEGLLRDDPDEVVSDMVLAVREEYPKAHYRTGGTADAVVRFLNHLLPSETADYVLASVAKSNGVCKKVKDSTEVYAKEDSI